jgi:hypothetical protein
MAGVLTWVHCSGCGFGGVRGPLSSSGGLPLQRAVAADCCPVLALFSVPGIQEINRGMRLLTCTHGRSPAVQLHHVGAMCAHIHSSQPIQLVRQR